MTLGILGSSLPEHRVTVVLLSSHPVVVPVIRCGVRQIWVSLWRTPLGGGEVRLYTLLI